MNPVSGTQPVAIGVIGIGTIGSYHCRTIAASESMVLAAVCDSIPGRADSAAERYGAQAFYDHVSLLQSGICDAVVIATPHYSHTPIGIAALETGLHVLIEKPLSVHIADCRRLLAARRNETQVCAIMYNQRTDPRYRAVRQLIRSGAIGSLQRFTWIITNWYRPELYYQSSDWRATWAGEGGGVLMNQCIHQLDLLQWLCGMPTRVRAFCGLGKFHAIEVEDEVTACLEYARGLTGMLQATTGEYPGTNRLEIAGDRGRLILEGSTLQITRNDTSTLQLSREADSIFAVPGSTTEEMRFDDHGDQHKEILENFAEAIMCNKPLIAPAGEGIHAVELANAMLYSALRNETVTLPLDSQAYETLLKILIDASGQNRKTIPAIPDSLSDSDLDTVIKTRWRSHP